MAAENTKAKANQRTRRRSGAFGPFRSAPGAADEYEPVMLAVSAGFMVSQQSFE